MKSKILGSLAKFLPYRSMAATASTLGLHRDTLTRYLNGKRSLTLERLDDLLHSLGHSPEAWLHSVTRPHRAGDLLPPSTWQPRERPAFLRALHQQASRLPRTPRPCLQPVSPTLPPESVEEPWSRTLATVDSPGLLGFLEALPTLAQEDPELALRLAKAAAQRAPEMPAGQAQIFATAAGVTGSIYRIQGQLEEAVATLHLALLVAERAALPLVEAELHRRAAYVLRDLMRYQEALGCLTEAAVLFQRSWDLPSLARVAVDRGIILADAGEPRQALLTLQHAINSLGADDSLHRASAYHRMGQCAAELDLHEEAVDYFSALQALVPAEQTYNRSILMIEQGHLHLKAGEPQTALELFQRARQLLAVNPISQAAATFEIMKALAAQGQTSRLIEEAKTAILLLEPLRERAPVQAMLELLQGATHRTELGLETITALSTLMAEAHGLSSSSR